LDIDENDKKHEDEDIGHYFIVLASETPTAIDISHCSHCSVTMFIGKQRIRA